MEQSEEVFLDLEARLLEDDDGAVKRELETYLSEWRRKVKRYLDGGLPPDDFARFQRIEEGIAQAEEVVSKLWSLLHP